MIDICKLKDIREDNDVSQVQMSKILKINRSTYSLWELGINIIPLKELCDYANYFNLSIDYVLGLTNERNNFDKKIILNLETLGKNLKKLRLEHNLSQETLSEILGVTQACITRYEKGLICISTTNLYNYSKFFNTTMTELI
ncbi:MAG: helix-turn-helix transcriptional regulator [bacterium]